tara:strand:+ start:883 stop:1779 length:897 start_codon:yes stop_codon:yes gene_type:complete
MIETKDRITQYLIRGIYADRITSPLYQLFVIEGFAKKHNIPYTKISRDLRKETKDIKRCISCLKVCEKPCHTINMDDISYLRKRKNQTGTAKGNSREMTLNPKEQSIKALINSIDTLKLNEIQKQNINDNLKDLKPELLTLFTGIFINAFDDEKANTPEEILIKGLTELLPKREKDFIKTGKAPKYKAKIEIKEYITFWNSANRLGYLKEAFKNYGMPVGSKSRWEYDMGIDNQRLLITFNAIGNTPFPCEKDEEWHLHIQQEGNIKWFDDGWYGSPTKHFQENSTMNKRIGISIKGI